MSDTDKQPVNEASADTPETAAAATQAGAATGAAGTEQTTSAEAQALAQALAERDAARAESEANREHYLRTLADLDNYRRRVQREKDEARQIAVGRLLEDFVPVYDTFGLALLTLKGSSDPSAIAKGVEMIQVQFRSALEKNGVAEINPAPGSDFDPNKHESISAQPHATIPEGKVSAVFRTGFTAGTRLLRPASVILSTGPAAVEATQS